MPLNSTPGSSATQRAETGVLLHAYSTLLIGDRCQYVAR